MSKKSGLNRVVADQLRQSLINNGYKEPQLSMLMAQSAHETAGFNHRVAIENNNLGGVKYQTTFKGIAVPSDNYFAPVKEDPIKSAAFNNDHRVSSSERVKKKGVPYARFNGIDDFVRKWIPSSHLNEMIKDNSVGAPLNATNLDEYAYRLKLNHYYQDTGNIYLKGMQRWNKNIQETYSPVPRSPQSLPEGMLDILNTHKN